VNCPKCNEVMEFEELKNFFGYWYCECGYEADGSRIPCESDGVSITDCEESIT